MTHRAAKNVGLCLGGGGIAGAVYEVGCLAALENRFERFRANEADLYIGTSSGAALATALAGGISVERLYRSFLDPADVFFRLQRRKLLGVDYSELKRAGRFSFMALRKAFSSAIANPSEIDLWRELERFVDCLPAGVFTLGRFERFFADFMLRREIPERFDRLPKRLLLAARELDSGDRAVFGAGALSDVAVSRAVAACCATPPFFSPVRISGRDYVDGGPCDPAPIDLAEPFNCSLIVVIVPTVPAPASDREASVPTGHGPRWNMRDKGIWGVYNQWLRLRSSSITRTVVERFQLLRPHTEVLLLEPSAEVAAAFLHSPMNYAARRFIIEEAYTTTIKQLEWRKASFKERALAIRLDVPTGAPKSLST
jgi:predicted acylesterase/phospholipase RssA